MEKQGWARHSKMTANKESVTMIDVDGSLSKPTKRPLPPRPLPCAGVTKHYSPGVVQYLQRTGAPGGGSRSVHKIAKEWYGRAYATLDQAERALVVQQQRHEQTWRNSHSLSSVFSCKCEQTVPVKHGQVPAHPICPPCLSVSRSRSFKAALRVPMPAPEHYKHLNHQYRNETLGHLYARTAGLQELVESGASV